MSSTIARAAILGTLRAALAASPLDVPSAPAPPTSLPVGPDAWQQLAATLEPLEVRLRLASTPAQAAQHVADIARERACATYTRWDKALDFLPLDHALATLTRVYPGVNPGVTPGCCQALAQVDLGLVLAHAILLDSGSFALAAATGQQRSASLLPPASVILAPRSALLPDVSHLPALLERYRASDGSLPSCLNLVTGPSSTADIELVLVRGVHGPGSLDVVGLDWDV